MGCGVFSQRKKKKIVVALDMKKIGVQEIDNIFDTVSIPLATLANVFNMLKKATEKFKKRTHVYVLVDNTVDDAITALLYGLSADTNGDFSLIDLEIESEPPFIIVSKGKCGIEMHEALDSWNHLVAKIIEANTTMRELQEKIEKITQDAPEMTENIGLAISRSNLNDDEAKVMGKIIASNLEKITRSGTVLYDTLKMLENLNLIIKQLRNRLDHEGRQKIHTVGKVAYQNNEKNLRNIVIKFWPEQNRVDVNYNKYRRYSTHAVR